MFANYLKTALRNLLKHKGHSAINIFGLSVGIACCVLIMLFVRNELSYDTFHENAERIYRAYVELEIPGRTITTPNLPIPFGPAVESDLPEVKSVVRFQQREGVVRSGDNLIRQEILFSDPEILQVFSYPLQTGHAESALTGRNSVVISGEMADKYFADNDPIGEELAIRLNEEELLFDVSGVIADIPQNSSIQFDFLVPFERLFELSQGAQDRATDWTSYSTVTFLELQETATVQSLDDKFPAFAEKYISDPAKILLQPLTDIHLNSELGSGGLAPVSDPKYSYILAGIALAVLLIACINFTTLSLGRAAGRAREVGMRKVLGAQRSQLMKQFWGEAIIMSFFALILGLGLAEGFLPIFNQLTEKQLDLNLTGDAFTFVGLISLMLLAGILAGAYPALLLSKYEVVEVFKSKIKLSGATTLGKILVVFQFTLSVVLIVCAIVMSQQKDFLMNKNLGFRGEQVVVSPTIRSEDGERLLENMKRELASEPEILAMSGTSFSFNRGFHRVIASYEENNIRTYEYRVDYDYLSTLELELLQGRQFSKSFATDPDEAAIVNQALVEEFGWDDPLGKTFVFRGRRNLTVVGVVKNYHFESLHKQIEPVVLHMDPNTPIQYLLVRIQPGNFSGTLAILESTWRKLAPGLPFEAEFLDSDVAEQYRAEQRWGQIVTSASVLAVLIACLGLLGLASLSVERRTKEIGIRKVLGASHQKLVGIMTKEFVVLVIIGNLVAWPLAFWAMNKWLESFAYRIDLTFTSFLIAAGIVLTITVLTVSYHALRAALANPVDSLRYE